MNLLKSKTLIVTGASRGIGKALALELARGNVNLVLNARSALLLAEVQRQCNNSAVRVTSVVGDISQPKTAHELVAEAVKLGNFYGFIHDAGLVGSFARGSAGALRRPPETRFLCKKVLRARRACITQHRSLSRAPSLTMHVGATPSGPGPFGKDSNRLAAYQDCVDNMRR